jgi:hypothetical protein
MTADTKIYMLSGLGADKRAFRFLKLDFIDSVEHIEWITPNKDDTIETYCKKLIEKYKIQDNSIFIGLSFGGILSIEIAKLLKPLKIILISSVRNKYDLPPIMRFLGRVGLTKLIPKRGLRKSNSLLEHAMGIKKNKEQKLFSKIMSDTDAIFAKWAISKISNWKESHENKDVIRIHGKMDKLIPFRNQVEYPIENGTHIMIMQKANEISDILNTEIKRLNQL